MGMRTLKVGNPPRRVNPPNTVQPPTGPSVPASFIDITKRDEGIGTSWSFDVPTNVTGDRVYVHIVVHNGSVSTGPSGWTLLTSYTTNNPYSYIYYRDGGGLSSTYSVSLTEGSDSAWIAFTLRGVSSQEVSSFYYVADSDVHNPPQITPAAAPGKYLVICFHAFLVGDAPNEPSGSTNYSKVEFVGGGLVQPHSYIQQAVVDITTSEDPSSFTYADWIGNVINIVTMAVPYYTKDASVASGSHTHNLNDATDLGTDGSTKGDILVFDGASWQALPVGSNGQRLRADSAADVGVSWQ